MPELTLLGELQFFCLFTLGSPTPSGLFIYLYWLVGWLVYLNDTVGNVSGYYTVDVFHLFKRAMMIQIIQIGTDVHLHVGLSM